MGELEGECVEGGGESDGAEDECVKGELEEEVECCTLSVTG